MTVERRPVGHEPTPGVRVLVYLVFVGVGAVLAFALERGYGIPRNRVIMLYGGATFLLCSLGRPWWLYATIRRLGWFGNIKSDAGMRTVLALLGVVLLFLGAVAFRG